jgi:hypothetical protein
MFSMKHKNVRGLVVFLFIVFSANLANTAISYGNALNKTILMSR